MKTTNRIRRRIRKIGLGFLRNTPRIRKKIRWGYWDLQRWRYNRTAASKAVDHKLVFFEAFGGRAFSDSPKALYLEMLSDERFDNYHFVWSLKKRNVPYGFPYCISYDAALRTEVVIRGSEAYFAACARAGTIIINNRLPEYVVPKSDQTYVQCWHGTPLKRLGYDVADEAGGALNTASELAERFGMDMEKWTYLLSPSPYASQHLADAFGLPEERRPEVIIEEGYPRNDVLARAAKDPVSQLKARQDLGLPRDKKLLLYAPTYRDDSYISGLGYSLDLDLDFGKMQAALGNEWEILFRPHYYIANQFDFSVHKGFVINAADFKDINTLYLAADALLTDYSSVMFDFAILRRPIALFVPDYKHYEESVRGFYFPLAEVPGPLCMTTEEVIEAINTLDNYAIEYKEIYDRFIERFAPYDDGNASKRVLKRVFPAKHKGEN